MIKSFADGGGGATMVLRQLLGALVLAVTLATAPIAGWGCHESNISVYHDGWYTAQVHLVWTIDGQGRSYNSSWFNHGQWSEYTVPSWAHDVHLWVSMIAGGTI